MEKLLAIRLGIISIIFICYFIFTFRYSRILRKSLLFTSKLRLFHMVMIWIIPFVWVLILIALSKQTPGSYEVENKIEPQPFSKTGGKMWTS